MYNKVYWHGIEVLLWFFFCIPYCGGYLGVVQAMWLPPPSAKTANWLHLVNRAVGLTVDGHYGLTS